MIFRGAIFGLTAMTFTIMSACKPHAKNDGENSLILSGLADNPKYKNLKPEYELLSPDSKSGALTISFYFLCESNAEPNDEGNGAQLAAGSEYQPLCPRDNTTQIFDRGESAFFDILRHLAGYEYDGSISGNKSSTNNQLLKKVDIGKIKTTTGMREVQITGRGPILGGKKSKQSHQPWVVNVTLAMGNDLYGPKMLRHLGQSILTSHLVIVSGHLFSIEQIRENKHRSARYLQDFNEMLKKAIRTPTTMYRFIALNSYFSEFLEDILLNAAGEFEKKSHAKIDIVTQRGISNYPFYPAQTQRLLDSLISGDKFTNILKKQRMEYTKPKKINQEREWFDLLTSYDVPFTVIPVLRNNAELFKVGESLQPIFDVNGVRIE